VSAPFLSEIKIMSFGFPPKGWALCNGQLLSINQNQALYSLLGTTYGGDGRINFGLPNLQGRTPNHMGQGLTLGQMGGEQTHTLTTGEVPPHTHGAIGASDNSDAALPTGNYLGAANNFYTPMPGQPTTLQPATVTTVGGSQSHENMQPYLVLNFCIALLGVFPSQT
jgi:microcystin-dependent protein